MSYDVYWYCTSCKEKFSKLDRHLMKRHALTGEPECPGCGNILSKKNMGESL
jgi:NAD-dependent SIR2 family protein deacetylase